MHVHECVCVRVCMDNNLPGDCDVSLQLDAEVLAYQMRTADHETVWT